MRTSPKLRAIDQYRKIGKTLFRFFAAMRLSLRDKRCLHAGGLQGGRRSQRGRGHSHGLSEECGLELSPLKTFRQNTFPEQVLAV